MTGRKFRSGLLILGLALGLTGAMTRSAGAETFSNPTPIAIPVTGVASPYPSEIEVFDLEGRVENVSVTLHDFSHGSPLDLRVLVVGPEGRHVMVMDHMGGIGDVSGIDLTFDDEGIDYDPATNLQTATYSPSGPASDAPMTAPAPPPSPIEYGTYMVRFAEEDPNDIWQLWVEDVVGGDDGTIAGGWSLSFDVTQVVKVLVGFKTHEFPDKVTERKGEDLIEVVAEGRGKARLARPPRSRTAQGPWGGTIAVHAEPVKGPKGGDLTVLRLVGDATYNRRDDHRKIVGPAEVKRSNLKGCKDGSEARFGLSESRDKKDKSLASMRYCGRQFAWKSRKSDSFNVTVKES